MLEIVKREKEISRSRIKKIEAVAKFKRVVNKSAEVILQTYTTATIVEVIRATSNLSVTDLARFKRDSRVHLLNWLVWTTFFSRESIRRNINNLN